MLIDAGAPVDSRDNNGATPLMNAAMCGHVEVAAVLRSAGADCAATSNNGKTAYDHAEAAGLGPQIGIILMSQTTINFRN